MEEVDSDQELHQWDEPVDMAQFTVTARNHLSKCVRLLVWESAEQEDLELLLKSSPLATLQDGTCCIIMDTNLWAMARHRPEIRKGPLNRDNWQTMVHAVMKVRGVDESASNGILPQGDIWLMVDAGREHTHVFKKSMSHVLGRAPKLANYGRTIVR